MKFLISILCVLSILVELSFDSTSSFIRVSAASESTPSAESFAHPAPACGDREARACEASREVGIFGLRALAKIKVDSHCAGLAIPFVYQPPAGAAPLRTASFIEYGEPEGFRHLRPPIS